MGTYFFDLDGTLVNSSRGLVNSFRAGLSAIGVSILPDQDLSRFLGTPLPLLFRAMRPAVSAREIDQGIAAFRDKYDRSGLRDSAVYPGVLAMLDAIRTRGDGALIVTSKPRHHADEMAERFGLDKFIDGVVGASLDETETKTDLVRQALAESGASANDVIFLGDRHYDVVGARENHVRPVGALWGYGSRAELEDAGCQDFAEFAADFQARFVDRPAGKVRVAA